MRITLSDFAAGIIAVWFLVAVFVWPFIGAWHVLYPPAHRSQSPASYRAPVKAGATLRHAHSSAVSIPEAILGTRFLRSKDRTMCREQGGSEHGVRYALGSETSLAESRAGVPLQTLATAAAHLCGIDPALFWSLVLRESSGRHWAQGRVLRSSSNALGMGQIKASTARGVSPHLDPLQPWDNAVASACYLRQQFDRFGTWRKALHAYHRGPNARGKTPQASHDYASDVIQGAN